MTARHYTEHSPQVQEVMETLREEWMVQYATRTGAQPRQLPKSKANHTVFLKSALLCLNFEIDPSRLVSTALELGAVMSYVGPGLMRSDKVLQALGRKEAADSEGDMHPVISRREAAYRAEVNKIRVLLKAGTPPLHILDESYALRPLVLWVYAKKQGFDTTKYYFDAAAEYKRNRAEADVVFGNEILRGLL